MVSLSRAGAPGFDITQPPPRVASPLGPLAKSSFINGVTPMAAVPTSWCLGWAGVSLARRRTSSNRKKNTAKQGNCCGNNMLAKWWEKH